MTTRRFDLSTRAGWIEHHHVDFSKSIFSVPREAMLQVGPGDYDPKEMPKHVSTPSLGGSQASIANIVPTTFGSSSRIIRHGSPRQINESRMELVTHFHDYGVRQPIDTARRYCPTPGPQYYEEKTILSEMTVDGKKTLKKIDFTDTPRFQGVYDKIAIPHHDINYDSKHLKPAVKLGLIPKTRRLPIQIGDRDTSLTVRGPECYREDHHQKMSRISPPSSPSLEQGTATMPLSPIRRPKLKHISRNEFVFDASCYTNLKKELRFNLSPGSIAHVVPKNMFGHLMAAPRQHQSRAIK
jgi:hypothetical protein